MNRTHTHCHNSDFGPFVRNCRDDFDLTLLFEETVLSKLVKYLFPSTIQPAELEQTALALYAVVSSALVALWAARPGLRSWSSVAAAALSLLNAVLFCSLSYLEHARSIQPSTTLIVYPLFSTGFDIVRCCTLWLVARGSSLTQLFTASIVLRALVLILESAEKAKYLPAEIREKRPEEASSIFNRGVFYWLNQLMVRGSCRLLFPDDLYIVVAFLAVIIAALAVSQRSNGGFAGLALTQVMLINLTLRSIIISWTEVETSISAVSKVNSFSENTPSEHRPSETIEPAIDWPHSGKIEFETLTALYETAPDQPALKKLSLAIQPGEKIGVCGRSGSGKSSLVLTLCRMLEIQHGELKIDGLDLRRIPRTTEPLFLPGTVRVNLDPRGESPDPALIEALAKVHLWPTLESRGGLDGDIRSDLLSHGQRQLFCLASAILRKSKIAVLDEATSNADQETDELMQQIIREEFRGCTIIAVAHRLNTIVDFDRVAVLDHGVLCEVDTPQALLSRDSRFRAMWGERDIGREE